MEERKKEEYRRKYEESKKYHEKDRQKNKVRKNIKIDRKIDKNKYRIKEKNIELIDNDHWINKHRHNILKRVKDNIRKGMIRYDTIITEAQSPVISSLLSRP